MRSAAPRSDAHASGACTYTKMKLSLPATDDSHGIPGRFNCRRELHRWCAVRHDDSRYFADLDPLDNLLQLVVSCNVFASLGQVMATRALRARVVPLYE